MFVQGKALESLNSVSANLDDLLKEYDDAVEKVAAIRSQIEAERAAIEKGAAEALERIKTKFGAAGGTPAGNVRAADLAST